MVLFSATITSTSTICINWAMCFMCCSGATITGKVAPDKLHQLLSLLTAEINENSKISYKFLRII